MSKGASETYVEQLESSRQQARALADEAQVAVAKSREALRRRSQLFFRIEEPGDHARFACRKAPANIRTPQVAQALAATYAEGGANRERLRGYIVNLAAEREHQFEVMDREAQRCRATLMAPAPPCKDPGRKK